jgi:hypothetical protein
VEREAPVSLANNPQHPTPINGGPERTILLIGGGVLAVVLVAVVAVLTIGSAEADDFPPDSPPGVIQQYLDAAYQGDRDTAFTFLSARARAEMTRDTFFRCYQDEQRVRVDEVTIDGNRATVSLEIESSSGSIFDFDEYDWERDVFLLNEDGGWKIDETYFCV